MTDSSDSDGSLSEYERARHQLTLTRCGLECRTCEPVSHRDGTVSHRDGTDKVPMSAVDNQDMTSLKV